jgi:hypothetical protein
MSLNRRAHLMVAPFYLSLVSGGVFTFHSDGLFNDLAKLSIAIISLVALTKSPPPRGAVKIAFAFGFVYAIPLFVSTFRSFDPDYAFYKIDAAIIGGIVCFLLAAALIERYGLVVFYKSFVEFAFFILAATILYKFIYGFADRNVRFLLNGPIIFGWLMGVSAIFSVFLWRAQSKVIYLPMALCFLLAVIWTQSKGPLVALSGSLAFMYFAALGNSQRVKIGLFFIFVGTAFLYFDFSEFLENSRLDAFQRLLSRSTSEADYGSVGVRAEMYEDAVSLFLGSPVFGVGLGNWKQITNSEFFYPHNQHLEILAEVGISYFLIYFALLAFSFLKADGLIRTVLFFFFVAVSFSGDFSYMRYVFSFCLIALWLSYVKNQDASP